MISQLVLVLVLSMLVLLMRKLLHFLLPPPPLLRHLVHLPKTRPHAWPMLVLLLMTMLLRLAMQQIRSVCLAVWQQVLTFILLVVYVNVLVVTCAELDHWCFPTVVENVLHVYHQPYCGGNLYGTPPPPPPHRQNDQVSKNPARRQICLPHVDNLRRV